jgi:outer membrane lipoprotein-sorting protein
MTTAKLIILILAILFAAAVLEAQATQPAQNGGGDLNSVLAKMNAHAGNFKTIQADLELETYQKIVDEKDLQKGHVYFRRSNKGLEAAFNFVSPAPKQVVFDGKDITMCEPKIDQCTKHDVSKNKADVDAFLSLGFGARGDDLQKSYDVTLAGWETLEGIQTARLELVPHDEKMRQTYNKIILWLDPEKDVMLQQKFIEPSQDYRLTRYSNIKLNGNLPGDAFKLRTTSNTKIVRSQ